MKFIPTDPRPVCHGFTLVELMIGVVLASFIAMGLYQTSGRLYKRTVTTTRNTRQTLEVSKVIERIDNELANVISLANSEGTALGNSPAGLTATGQCSLNNFNTQGNYGTDTPFAPNGLVPLPGLSMNEVDYHDYGDPDWNNFPTFLAPSDVTVTDTQNDALRIGYQTHDFAPRYLAALGTINLGDLTLDDVSDFNVGDYVIIYDDAVMEMFRITAINTSTKKISHGYKSWWNRDFKHYFPVKSILEKVEIATYALDPTTKTLYRDNHVKDDGFNPSTKTYTSGGPSPGYGYRVLNWQKVAEHVEQFQVFYHAWTDGTRTDEVTTRTPRAAKSFVTCGNQLGYDLFKFVEPVIKLEATSTNEGKNLLLSRRVSPMSLKRPPGVAEENLERSAIIIASLTPTPTPSGTATPAATHTPGGGAF